MRKSNQRLHSYFGVGVGGGGLENEKIASLKLFAPSVCVRRLVCVYDNRTIRATVL